MQETRKIAPKTRDSVMLDNMMKAPVPGYYDYSFLLFIRGDLIAFAITTAILESAANAGKPQLHQLQLQLQHSMRPDLIIGLMCIKQIQARQHRARFMISHERRLQ